MVGNVSISDLSDLSNQRPKFRVDIRRRLGWVAMSCKSECGLNDFMEHIGSLQHKNESTASKLFPHFSRDFFTDSNHFAPSALPIKNCDHMHETENGLTLLVKCSLFRPYPHHGICQNTLLGTLVKSLACDGRATQ